MLLKQTNAIIGKKQNYIENNKTIAINILDYNIFEDGPYHEKCMITRKYNNKILTDDLEMHFIQIPKCEKKEIKTTLDFWIRFISNMKDGEVEKMKGEMSKETMEAIIKAEEEYEKVMADPQAQRLIQRIKMARYDRMAGEYYARKTGMEEGRNDEKKEIAKKMKSRGINIAEIVEITGLTKEEIEKI